MWQILQDAWRPAVEIYILTVGIYYAFRFVRGTRGAPIVTGFLVVLLALGLGKLLLPLLSTCRRITGRTKTTSLTYQLRRNSEVTVIATCRRCASAKGGELRGGAPSTEKS